jgi:hypothetical protein
MARALHAIPKPPSVEEIKASSNPRALIDSWSAAAREAERFNNRIFEADLKLIFLCTFLNSFRGAAPDQHFSWCPEEKWAAYDASVLKLSI